MNGKKALLLTWIGVTTATGAGADDPAYLDVATLGRQMAGGELTAVELVDRLLVRIAELDDDADGPRLNAIIEINPEARRHAAELDRERTEQRVRGPLHGIPVVLKANIDTGDQMTTTAGSLALAGHRAPDDAFLVRALRNAGAVILGKANLSEWANFRSTRSSSGWSGIGGQTRNPHVLDRNPCGSSSGSAVAVAAGLAVLAVGTETDGSIVCPAGVNGIVGIKPTVGLVSRDGIIPIAHTQDTAGPMARSVVDAALLLNAMALPDPADPAATGHPGARDYTARLDRGLLRGVRVGVWRSHYGAGDDPRITELFEVVLQRLVESGAVLVDPVGLKLPATAGDAEYEVLLYEFKTDLNRYLASGDVAPGSASLARIIEFNNAHAETSLAWFGQEILLLAQDKGPLTDPGYRQALRRSHAAVRRAIDRVLARHDLDAIVAPTNSPAWPIDLVDGDRFSLSSSNAAAVAGYPSITLPAGTIAGLPIGVSLFGAPFTEEALIGYAYALEHALAPPPRPQFRATLEE